MEDLMKPRFKVIADYLHSPYKVGDLLECSPQHRTFLLTQHDIKNEFGEPYSIQNYFSIKEVEKFPHLFKRLEWWEEREEMPKYIKQWGKVFEISSITWQENQLERSQSVYLSGCVANLYKIINFEPATESEYQEYIKNK